MSTDTLLPNRNPDDLLRLAENRVEARLKRINRAKDRIASPPSMFGEKTDSEQKKLYRNFAFYNDLLWYAFSVIGKLRQFASMRLQTIESIMERGSLADKVNQDWEAFAARHYVFDQNIEDFIVDQQISNPGAAVSYMTTSEALARWEKSLHGTVGTLAKYIKRAQQLHSHCVENSIGDLSAEEVRNLCGHLEELQIEIHQDQTATNVVRQWTDKAADRPARGSKA